MSDAVRSSSLLITCDLADASASAKPAPKVICDLLHFARGEAR